MHKLCLNGFPFGRRPSQVGTVLGGLDDLMRAAVPGDCGTRTERARSHPATELPDRLRREFGL